MSTRSTPSRSRRSIGLGDDAAGDHRLAEPDLVGDEEPARRVGRVEQAIERVLDRRALEVLEPREDLLGVDVDAHGARLADLGDRRPEVLELRWEQIGRSRRRPCACRPADGRSRPGARARGAVRAASARATGARRVPLRSQPCGAAPARRSVSRSSSSASMRSRRRRRRAAAG